MISLAESSAYVIGTGPHAHSLVDMLKARLMRKRCLPRPGGTALTHLIGMGFERHRVVHALDITEQVFFLYLIIIKLDFFFNNLTITILPFPQMHIEIFMNWL